MADNYSTSSTNQIQWYGSCSGEKQKRRSNIERLFDKQMYAKKQHKES